MQIKNFDGISVIMPTYNQGPFISRAIASLKAQLFQNWELIIINDGCTDYTHDVVIELLEDTRINYIINPSNMGLGACLNLGIEKANFSLIAYLPSDDIYFRNHLSSLYQTFLSNQNGLLFYSGLNYNYQDSINFSSGMSTFGKIPGYYYQLVQVMHLNVNRLWIERDELVTDDLDKMFFDKLTEEKYTHATNKITCEWVEHPEQRHRIIREDESGGINLYKQFYNVKSLIKFKSSVGNLIDEIQDYKQFRCENNISENSLKILIVGELAYNPERILALEERGHRLYGLWMIGPHSYNTIGPLPFGNVEDIPLENWLERVEEIKPDIIYALLNYQAVPFAHYIMKNNPGIPFVWHFKEGPFICRKNGVWKELIELYVNSDGQIYTNPEVRSWFNEFLSTDNDCTLLLDGDLPKAEFFSNEKSELLSEVDGEFHTVVPGRPFGISANDIRILANQKIHFHFYGDSQQSFWEHWIEMARISAPGYFHVHPHCKAGDWVKELSKYDAGWLHIMSSENEGEIMRASWYDLNYAARMTTLAAAGLPMLQKNNFGHISASYSLVESLGMGITFNSFEEIKSKLLDRDKLSSVRNNVWEKRLIFSFDNHADDLIAFFKKIIRNTREKINNN